MAVEAGDWEMLVGMRSRARMGLTAAGISTYEEAVAACADLAREVAALGAECKVDDFICFLSLSQSEEAVASMGFPNLAPPVSVRDDLGLDVPVPAPQARRRIMRKTSVSPAIASILAVVLPEVLRWSDMLAASYVSQCCRAFHAGGLFMASRLC